MNFDPHEFLDSLTSEVEKLGIDLSDTTLDHVAYQAATTNEYEGLRSKFEELGLKGREVFVNGRRLSVYKYKKPPIYKDQSIQAIELIEPVPNIEYVSGYDHAEFIPSIPLEEFLEKYPDIEWINALNREKFQMLILHLPKNMQVKFPRQSILSEQ